MRYIRSKNQLNENIIQFNFSGLLAKINELQNSLIFVLSDTLVVQLFYSSFFTSKIQCRWKQNCSNDLHSSLFAQCSLNRLITI
ncbi:hypothetical protein FGO68_gene11772 [Halteria grandinella]|uniref:Uncharacterized protein n=1 Tax=Halteria grandinella TaxID=5974 RepID=A0A8J8P2I9_HALGN|nr:hypothetical protein FGO68_gene11772 [Halteria grandinella]